MKQKGHTKKGSYLVEAVIVIPIFILAVLALISIIPVTATCENIIFAVADEMRMESAKSAFRKNPAALPPLLAHRIITENKGVTDYRTTFYRYFYGDKGVEDLFSIEFHASLQEANPLGLFDQIDFTGKVMARAFTGKIHKNPPVSSELSEKSGKVYIFPEWGMRYHHRRCTYVKANCQMVYLSQKTKNKYTPCRLCKASFAQIGSPVFCFTRSGRVYHLAECRSVERYYIEVDKSSAEAKGYSPCTKCGGS